MLIEHWLNQATQRLKDSKIMTARLDALVLLAYVTHLSKAQLLAYSDQQLTASQLKVLDQYLSKRAQHIPLSYLTHQSEFYGLDFIINSHVLVPRPESEIIIEQLIDIVTHDPNYKNLKHLTIGDIGCGSGILGITAAIKLAKLLPNTRLITDLIDIDKSALKLAKRNANKHHIQVNIINNNLLENIDTIYDILLVNLPYVPNKMTINKAASREPKQAIFGGEDGLDLYRQLFSHINTSAQLPKLIITESLPQQHQKLCLIAQQYNFFLFSHEDFVTVFKPMALCLE